MKTVNFTEMKSGNKDEYLLLDKYEKKYIDGTARLNNKFYERAEFNFRKVTKYQELEHINLANCNKSL